MKEKGKKIMFVLYREERDKLEKLAQEERKSKSQKVRELIRKEKLLGKS